MESVDYRLNQFYDALLTSEDPEDESSIHSQLRSLSRGGVFIWKEDSSGLVEWESDAVATVLYLNVFQQ